MKIQIKQLNLHNFKGAKDFKLSDLGNEVIISGANETGKTRIVDAWNWLLFGKDSEDRKDFDIKALDVNNQPLHRADHSVSAVLIIDGIEQKLERIYREKWVKKRGEENHEFDGNETFYKFNDVPHSQGEYQAKINAILPENLFKLLTNPFYFNTMMKWTERRDLLFKIAGDIKDQEILAGLPELRDLLDSLNGKSLEEFKKEIAFKKKLLKEQLSDIPARMDEVNRSTQPDPDYTHVEKQIQRLNKTVNDIDSLIASTAKKFEKKNQENQDKLNKVFELRQKVTTLEYNDRTNAEKAINDLKIKRDELQRANLLFEHNIVSHRNIFRTEENGMGSLTAENDKLRKDWTRINEEVLSFSEDEFICSTCGTDLSKTQPEKIEARKAEMMANFNTNKAARLKRITETGKGNLTEIERLKTEIQVQQKQILTITANITANQKEMDKIAIPDKPGITPDPQILILKDQIIQIEEIIESSAEPDNDDLTNKKQEIVSEIDDLKKQLDIRESNERLRARLLELENQQKSLSQQIASLEKMEFQCEKFTRTKVSMIEEKVNGLFSFVRFKMFNTQVNGGLEETCEALIKGVPFPSANNAGRINAGIDIINAFSKHYDVYAPIFTDNAEAINKILKTESQMIKLFVTKDKELKVVTN